MEQTLSEIANGASVVARSISTSALKVKLMEMGIIEGKVLTVLFRAPFGDPIAVDADGYILSLRLEEAALINVEPIQVVV